MASETPTPGIIIGGGRIGEYLYDSNKKADVFLSSRKDKFPSGEGSGPIYVCTRNNDLESIIEATPENRKEDLVFIQNGILSEYLKTKRLEDNTQALIYFAISKKGDAPIDGKTDLNPDGLTAVTGKWAKDLANRLNSNGLACHVIEKEPWIVAMLEKHIWICAVMTVGAKHGCKVGEVEKDHNEEFREIIRELAAAASGKEGVTFPDGLEDRLCAYSRSVAHFPTALKEFEWRNAWFANISKRAMENGEKDSSPKHTQILKDQNLL